MPFTRRGFVASSAAALAASPLAFSGTGQAAGGIRLGSVLDTSGIFDAYGRPMDMAISALRSTRSMRRADSTER